MRAEQIHELLVNPKSLKYEKHLPLLRDALKNYPYFTPSYVLIAKLLYEEKSIYFEKYLKLASLYMGDREVLYNYIHELAPTLAHLVESPKQEEVLSQKVEVAETKEIGKSEVNETFAESKEFITEEVEVSTNQYVTKVEEFETQETAIEQVEETLSEVLKEAIAQETIKEEVSELIELANHETIEVEESIVEEVSQEKVELTSNEEIIHLVETSIEEEIQVEFEPIINQDSIEVEELETKEAQSEEAEILLHEEEAEPELIQLVEKDEEESILETFENEEPIEAITTETEDIEKIDLIETKEPKVLTFLEWLATQRNNEIEVIQSNYNLIKKKEVNKIIENFIANEPKISRQSKAQMYNPIKKSVVSNQEDPEIVSETLATIFANQELFDQAIQQYQKLSILYPQKSSYFANLIEILEVKKAQKQ